MTNESNWRELAFSRGRRLRQARLLSGLSSVQFCKDSILKHPCYRAWETGVVLLNEKRANMCIKMLYDKGVKCCLKWLLDGKNIPPKTSNNIALSPTVDIHNFDYSLQSEVETFLKNTPNSLVFKLNNQDALPIYPQNSHLGCVKISKSEQELGCFQNCIIQFNEGDPIIVKRICQVNDSLLMLPINMCGEYEIMSLNQDINLIAQIVWHRVS